MLHRDYLMRLIEQVVQAVAKMLGLIEEGKAEVALKNADQIYDLLGVPRELVEVSPSETLVQLLPQPDKMRLLARVLAAEGAAHAELRDPLSAVKKRRLALELYVEAHALEPKDGDMNEIQELGRYVPTSALAERFRR